MTAPFIMLVDDEIPFVETMAKRLTKRNVQTITAFSGKESLEKLKTHQIILASGSPRRQQFFKELGMDFEVRLKSVEEIYPENLKGKGIRSKGAGEKGLQLHQAHSGC